MTRLIGRDVNLRRNIYNQIIGLRAMMNRPRRQFFKGYQCQELRIPTAFDDRLVGLLQERLPRFLKMRGTVLIRGQGRAPIGQYVSLRC